MISSFANQCAEDIYQAISAEGHALFQVLCDRAHACPPKVAGDLHRGIGEIVGSKQMGQVGHGLAEEEARERKRAEELRGGEAGLPVRAQ